MLKQKTTWPCTQMLVVQSPRQEHIRALWRPTTAMSVLQIKPRMLVAPFEVETRAVSEVVSIPTVVVSTLRNGPAKPSASGSSPEVAFHPTSRVETPIHQTGVFLRVNLPVRAILTTKSRTNNWSLTLPSVATGPVVSGPLMPLAPPKQGLARTLCRTIHPLFMTLTGSSIA